MVTAFLSLALFMARGQQQLSYSYDASGNRTARSVAVGGQELSGDGMRDDARFYAHSPKGKPRAVKRAMPPRPTRNEAQGPSMGERMAADGERPSSGRKEQAGHPAKRPLRIAYRHKGQFFWTVARPMATNLPPRTP